MITIIISAYKNDEYVIEALNSVVESAKNFEYEILLGVDNCSQTMDGLIKNYNQLPQTLKIFYFPKVGTYVIRNSLAKESKYEKLIFFDSDDIMSIVTIEETIKLLENNDIVKFKYSTFKNNFDEINKNLYQKSSTYHYGCFGIRKDSFLGLNGFEPWICAADGEFQWRAEANSYRITGVEKTGFYYRRHTTNLTIAGPTSMNSPLRKHYHNIKNDKIRTNQKQKLQKLYDIEFLKIDKTNLKNYNIEFNKLNINNPYNFEKDFELNKKKKSDALKSVLNVSVEEPAKNEYKDLSVKSTIQQKKSQIDYDRVNYVFQNNNIRVTSMRINKPTNQQPVRNNTSFLNKLNKKR